MNLTSDILNLYTLTDVNCIQELIKQRSSVDDLHYIKNNPDNSVYTTAGIYPTNEEAIVIYADLDNCIEAAMLDDEEQLLIEKLMEGYSIKDICELYFTYSRYIVNNMFKNICFKIKKVNDDIHDRWIIENGKTAQKIKFCKKCEQKKFLFQFDKKAYTKDGHSPICNDCKRDYNKRYYQEILKEKEQPKNKFDKK